MISLDVEMQRYHHFYPMKNSLLYLMSVGAFLLSCGWNDRMRHLDAAKEHADKIIRQMESDSVYDLFPETFFRKPALEQIVGTLRDNCDWPARRGQFTDYYAAENDGRHDIAYVYEYFLDCDSLRFVFTFHADGDRPELYAFTIEPIESPTHLLVDPMKSILKDKDWETKQKEKELKELIKQHKARQQE
jgi:hypothetical protein